MPSLTYRVLRKIRTQKSFRKLKTILPFSRSVDFIVCGTQKAGTTALDAYLREHPEICMANLKEVHYFDNDEYFSNEKPDYSIYHAFFSPKKKHKILGEVTPIYMYWNEVPRRIFDYKPEIKLIIILRNPIERAYSHWNMQRNKKEDNLSFHDAIHTEKERCSETLPLQNRRFSYIDRGHYLDQLRRIWQYFPKEKVLILKTEDLKHNPTKTLNLITDFLGVSDFGSIESKKKHSRTYASKMTKEEKNYLKTIFEPEIRELEIELGWDCSDWL